jgi:hypothetical protein
VKAPDGFEKWNPAMRGAFRKGYDAGVSGYPCSSPYADKRKDDGRLTWSRAFASAWRDGWLAGDEQRKCDAITAFYTEGAEYGRRPSTWVR